jgi:hypothetical protein
VNVGASASRRGKRRVLGRLCVCLALLACAGAALGAGGADAGQASPGQASFVSSDPELNEIWSDSVLTATDMIAPGPLSTDAEGRPCAIDLPQVLLDGLVRDRCPYVGDQAVTGMTLLISTPSAAPLLRAMILWYAQNQHVDGAIPASPLNNGQMVLFDYNAFWVEDLYDYVLYTGDLSLAQQVWPELVALMDGWFPAQAGPDGLLVNSLGPYDYAFIPRVGTVIAYYNAGYVRALRFAAALANWIGETAQASAWLGRIPPLKLAFQTAFWDAKAGAFTDSTVGPPVHPEDGNAFAILAKLATHQQALEALEYLTYHDSQPYGATIADNDTWSSPAWGGDASARVYPFISYFELLARFSVGLDSSAVALILREWGNMLIEGPSQRMWEDVGPGGSAPVSPDPSWDHGWSSGAAPALTDEVLGITPAAPGFTSFAAEPHPSGLSWARGTVPTPQGPIAFAWSRTGSTFRASIDAPVAGTITLPVGGSVRLDGRQRPASIGQTVVELAAGAHTLVVTSTPGQGQARVAATRRRT